MLPRDVKSVRFVDYELELVYDFIVANSIVEGVINAQNLPQTSNVKSIDAIVHAWGKVETVEPVCKLTKDDCIENLNFPECGGFGFSPENFEGAEGAGSFTNSGVELLASISVCSDFAAEVIN